MGIPVIIYGKSGSGKSRSLKAFSPEEITLINVLGKPLPFKGAFRYTINSDNYNDVFKALKALPTNAAVIDDATYLMTNMFMRGHAMPQSGGSVFSLYNDIGDFFWSLIRSIQQDLPADTVVYLMMHEEPSGDLGDVKLKTIGKLLDEKVCIEGLVTVALHCVYSGEKHVFKTHTNGRDVSKSPEGMFPSDEIPNDLKAVDAAIRDYWSLPPLGKRTKQEAKETKEKPNTKEETRK